jgi:hypothetical protein
MMKKHAIKVKKTAGISPAVMGRSIIPLECHYGVG